MTIESLSYADLAGRLGTSREAARSLVRRLRLPRQTGNDGTVRVHIDLAEIQHNPLPRRPTGGHRANFEALKSQIDWLQFEITKLATEKSSIEAIATGNRTDFERERKRSDKLMTNLMTLASVAMSARAKAARLESELTARRSQFWTRRRRSPQASLLPNASPKAQDPIMQSKSIPAATGRVRTFAELAALVMFAALITAFVEYGITFLVR